MISSDELQARLDALGVRTTTDLRSVMPQLDFETKVALLYGTSDAATPRHRLRHPSDEESELGEAWDRNAAALGFGTDEEYLVFGRGLEHDGADWPMREALSEALGYDVDFQDAESREQLDEWYALAEAQLRRHVATLKGRLRDADRGSRPAAPRGTSRSVPAVQSPRRVAGRAPRSRRVSRPGSRARSPGRLSGDDDPPSRPPLVARREAGA